MKATKNYYLKLRSFFILNGFKNEVHQLDNYFNLTFLIGKDGKIIKII